MEESNKRPEEIHNQPNSGTEHNFSRSNLLQFLENFQIIKLF